MTSESLEELRERLLLERRVQQMIQVRAYEIYQMRGGKPGGEAQDWFHAEGEVLAFLLASESAKADDQVETEFAEATSALSPSPQPPATKKPNTRTRSKPFDAKQAPAKKAAPKRTSTKKPTESKPKSRRSTKQSKAEESSQ